MEKFIDKYRLIIGILLVVVILASTFALLYLRRSGARITENAVNTSEIDDLSKKISDLETRIAKLEGEKTVEATNTSSGSENTEGLININTADQKTLESLPGIGEKRAADIITYRETNGGFKTISEIKNIKGIGESIFGQIQNLITIAK